MTAFLDGFGDELVKLGIGAGALKSIGKFTVKHPLMALSAPFVVGGTVMSAREGHRRGMSGEGRPRLLAAGVNKYTGEAMPSGTAFADYNKIFGTQKTRKGVSKTYDKAGPGAFKG